MGVFKTAEEEVVVVVCMLEGFPFVLEHMLLWLEVEEGLILVTPEAAEVVG